MQNFNSLAAYAAYSKDYEIRRISSSGALFSLFAEYVLSLEGVIYGVAMTNDCRGAEFIRVECIEELSKLYGSKYLQASMGNTFKHVKQDLENQILVLFTGVGCQINGLKIFLGKEYENLLCIDLICHGVPSPHLWKKYVNEFERANKAKLKSVNFRYKNTRWTDSKIERKDGEKYDIYVSREQDPYMQMFLRNYCLRPSCYECAAKKKRKSDITIGDFWGIENVAPEMNDNKGISIVIVRTDKGAKLFDAIEDKIFLKSVTYKEGVKANSAEYESVKRPVQRDMFFNDMNTMTFTKLKNKYVSIYLRRKVKGILLRICSLRFMKKDSDADGTKQRSNDDYGIMFTFEKVKKRIGDNSDD